MITKCLLLICTILLQPTACLMTCTVQTPANYKEWSHSQTDEVVIWEVNKVCSSYEECYGIEGPNTIHQLKPVLTQNGVLIDFQSSSKTLKTYKTDGVGFLNCNFVNGILVEDMSNVHVTTGNNYFIANDTTRPWNKCMVGLRVNISLIASACSAAASETICNNRGKCLASSKQRSFGCICCEGYVGDYCEKLNGCYSSTNLCLNGGACTDGLDINPSTSLYSCSCPEGFTGKNCEKEDLGSCKRNECMNGGRCEENESTTNGFQCFCAAGFEGQVCENEINECASAPCLNGGTCQDGVNKFTCKCGNGFGGKRCEIDERLCKPGTCKNGGTCDGSSGVPVCFCAIGFDGNDCSKEVTMTCGLCKNAKQCSIYSNGSYSCVCHYGFYGDHCESKINTSSPSCASNPCTSRSRCEEREKGYMCRCDDGSLKLKCNDTVKETLSFEKKTITSEKPPIYIFIILAIVILAIVLASIILLIIYFRRKKTSPPFQPYSISEEVRMKDLKNSNPLSSPAECFQDDSFPDESLSISTLSSNLSYDKSRETPVVKRSAHKNVTA